MKGGECFEKTEKSIIHKTNSLVVFSVFQVTTFQELIPQKFCMHFLSPSFEVQVQTILFSFISPPKEFHISYAININLALFIIILIKYSWTKIYFSNHPLYLERGI
jgi:hypothetical protein